MIGAGIIWMTGGPPRWTVTLFPGTMPANTQDIVDNWATAYNTTYLISWSDTQWQQPNDNVAGVGNKFVLSNSGAAVTAGRSGTATWGILWPGSVSMGASLPESRFLIGDVGIVGANTMFRMMSTTIVSGTSYTLTDASIVANLPY